MPIGSKCWSTFKKSLRPRRIALNSRKLARPHYQLIAFEACLATTAQNREMLLRNFYQIGRKAVERTAPPYAYLIPPQQKDLPAPIKLLDTLRFGMVEIHRARQEFVADAIEYPAGSYVVLLAQPYGSFAKTLLERQKYPDLREYPGGPPKRPDRRTVGETCAVLLVAAGRRASHAAAFWQHVAKVAASSCIRY